MKKYFKKVILKKIFKKHFWNKKYGQQLIG